MESMLFGWDCLEHCWLEINFVVNQFRMVKRVMLAGLRFPAGLNHTTFYIIYERLTFIIYNIYM